MTEKDLVNLKNWFSDYIKSFYSADNEDQKNIMTKVEHTYHVCENIVAIAKGLNLSSNDIRLAETVALFHDVGRFPQYAKYMTFRDAVSVSHGRLGAKTLINEKAIQSLPGYEQELIIHTVKFHGAFALPNTKDKQKIFFLKLIRDADKVDIFRVFIKYYETPKEDRASATAFGLPDTSEYSQVMLSCILQKKVASYSNLRNENDFKLMKLSWIYDMYFDESITLLQGKNYINRVIEKLPQTDEVVLAMSVLKGYISERLSAD
jgi:hypothetical protein